MIIYYISCLEKEFLLFHFLLGLRLTVAEIGWLKHLLKYICVEIEVKWRKKNPSTEVLDIAVDHLL